MVVGSVEVTHQNPAEGLAQDLVHHLLAPAPAQEEPLRRRTESPDVAVSPILPPARLISVDHRAGTDTLQRLAHFRPSLPGNLTDGPDDGPNAQFQLMERSQIPLDGPYGQPALFPQGHDQAHQVGSKALPARSQTLQRVPGQPPFPAQRTGPGYEYVLRDFRRDYRNVYDLPGPLRPTPGESGMAFGARLRGVDHPPGGFHPRPGEAVLTLLSRLLFFPRRLLAPGGRFVARHPGPRPAAAGQARLQAFDPLPQFRDNLQQRLPARLVQVQFRFHCSLMPQSRPGRQHFSAQQEDSAYSPHQV